MRGVPAGAWWSGSTTLNNRIKSLGKIKNNNLAADSNRSTNECNNRKGNPPTNNPMCVISDTDTTKNYTKVGTPCENKVKTTRGPQVLLTDGIFM